MRAPIAATESAFLEASGRLEIAEDFAAGHGGESTIGIRRDALFDEADAAVAEEEMAAAGVDAAEAGDDVVFAGFGAAVGAAVVAIQRRQHQRIVHTLVPGWLMAAAQRGHAQTA